MALSLSLTSCNDWLNLLPDNEQVTEDFWQSKEDVESVVASGYYYMRKAVPTLIVWGELRGGDFYNQVRLLELLPRILLSGSSVFCGRVHG